MPQSDQPTPNHPVETPKRIGWLDAAKGLGILLVVLGHNQIKADFPIVYQVVYSFHMPFFFLLSGMFFKTNYGFMELVRRRFDSLLKPFIAYMAVVYIGTIFFTKVDLTTIFGHILKALYAGPNTLEWVPLWFLPHLFIVNLFAFCLIKWLYDRLPRLWMRGLFLAALLTGGVAAIKVFWPVNFSILNHPFEFYGLPWSADLLLITTSFFILGYEIRRTFLETLVTTPYSRWVPIGALVIFAGLNIAFQFTIDFYIRSYGSPAVGGQGAVDLYAQFYGPVVVTLEAVSGSLLILYLAKWLEKGSVRVFGWLKALGGASVVVLIFHFVPQAYLYQKLIALDFNSLTASILAFCAGVLFPLLLYAWVIRPNAFLSNWFGLGRLQKPVETP